MFRWWAAHFRNESRRASRWIHSAMFETLYGHAGREKEGTHRAGCKLSVLRNQGWICEKRGRAAPTPATPPTTSPSFA